LRLDVRFEDPTRPGRDGDMIIDVVAPDGRVALTVREENIMGPVTPPLIEDIDGDGDADFLVQTSLAAVNSEKAVYRVSRHGDRIGVVRIGQIGGVERTLTNDGLLAVLSRSGAAFWGVEFYRFDADALTPIAMVSVEALAVDGERVTQTACHLMSASGIASMGLTEEAAEARFCAEPAAMVFE